MSNSKQNPKEGVERMEVKTVGYDYVEHVTNTRTIEICIGVNVFNHLHAMDCNRFTPSHEVTALYQERSLFPLKSCATAVCSFLASDD